MDATISVLWTLALLGLIVWVCSVFTNGIEWVGHRFNLSEGAVGSVLAAVGTALPETMVPLVAFISGAMGLGHLNHEDGQAIGVGAILGAPFLLSTLAMFTTGFAVFAYTYFKRRTTDMKLDKHLSRRDLQYFFVAYGLVVAAAFVPNQALHYALAGLLVAIYGYYVYKTLTIEHIPDSEFHLDPLMFAPRSAEPSSAMILLQVFIGLAGIVGLAHLFVGQVNHMSSLFGIPSLILSLIITPIATELPEKFNSVMWIGKGKDNLALGNITGAMVFQSCIPTAVGLIFTPWVLTHQAFLSIVLCFMSAIVMYLLAFQRWEKEALAMLAGGLFYLIFIGLVLT